MSYPEAVKRTVLILVVIGLLAALVAVFVVFLRTGASEDTNRSTVPSGVLESSETARPSGSPSTTASSAPIAESVSPSAEESNGARPTIPGVAAVITLAAQGSSTSEVLVGGFVSGVIEDGGGCQFVVTAKDTGASVVVDAVGSMNVDSTTCGSHSVPAPQSGTREYSVTLEYSNATGAVLSAPVSVEGS